MLIAIAAAILSTAAPATPLVGDMPATVPAARVKAADPDPRVCIVDQVTGSRLPVRVCKKLSKWRAEGIDPLAKR